ncbi:MAG: phosphoribosylformylglycinamidine synthase subunit PurQ [Terricaulis sp.]
MQSAVIVFPGSNCDRDAARALERVSGRPAHMVWHKETTLPDGIDLAVLPGGFSYGDYLRSGAMAAKSPVVRAVVAHAERGGLVLGICNGFQVLTETRLLPGALGRNAGLKFACKEAPLAIANCNTAFTRAYREARETAIPIAHGDGRFVADEDTLDRLENEGRVVFRYLDNPNGSARDIAGIVNERGNVLGMMPHPERATDPALGRTGGAAVFQSLLEAA